MVGRRRGADAVDLGGDEFCLLTHGRVDTPPEVPRRAMSALSMVCDGLAISASAGAAVIAGEAQTASDALRLADERMYENKRGDRKPLAALAA